MSLLLKQVYSRSLKILLNGGESMKKCKFCKGTGFTFTRNEYVSRGLMDFQLITKKESCRKCHGKGFK